MLGAAVFPLFAVLAGPAVSPLAQVAAPESFETLARQAHAAREAARDDEAIAAYRAAIALRPEWDEGVWYLGTLLYQAGRCDEADPVFDRFLQLKPRAGAGWVLRGLCSYDTRDYKAAVERLHRGLGLGLAGNAELDRQARLRLAYALVKVHEFELAIQPLTVLSRLAPESPDVIIGVGLALLRMPVLPSELSASDKDVVEKAGRAGAYHLADRAVEAEKAFAELAAAYPEWPWVNYARGVFLLRTDSERGIEALKQELRVNPGNVLACLDIAFELLHLRRNEEAKVVAERAVELSPTLFATHAALGRALVEVGEIERGIRELEQAASLGPDVAEVRFALARAYTRAGREADAARERAEFSRLDKQRAVDPAAPGEPGEVRP